MNTKFFTIVVVALLVMLSACTPVVGTANVNVNGTQYVANFNIEQAGTPAAAATTSQPVVTTTPPAPAGTQAVVTTATNEPKESLTQFELTATMSLTIPDGLRFRASAKTAEILQDNGIQPVTEDSMIVFHNNTGSDITIFVSQLRVDQIIQEVGDAWYWLE